MEPIGFQITGGKGFQIRFTNGYQVSVQFGPGNYADIPIPGGRLTSDFDRPMKDLAAKGIYYGGPTAEVAVFSPDSSNEFLPIGDHDDVIGWVAPERVAAILAAVAALSQGSTRDEVVAVVRATEQATHHA